MILIKCVFNTHIVSIICEDKFKNNDIEVLAGTGKCHGVALYYIQYTSVVLLNNFIGILRNGMCRSNVRRRV